jgi:hypothetical protein
MAHEFYGATIEAQQSINRLLSLPATGREQDWELELADPSRIEAMLDAITTKLSDNEKCALALITIASIEEAVAADQFDAGIIERARMALRKDKDVHEAMKFYWIKQGRATDEEVVRKLLLD